MELRPSASYSLTIRTETPGAPGTLGRVTTAVGEAGGDIDSLDLVRSGGGRVVRDVVVAVRDEAHGQAIVARLERLDGVRVLDVTDRTFRVHEGGKIGIASRYRVNTPDDLAM